MQTPKAAVVINRRIDIGILRSEAPHHLAVIVLPNMFEQERRPPPRRDDPFVTSHHGNLGFVYGYKRHRKMFPHRLL